MSVSLDSNSSAVAPSNAATNGAVAGRLAHRTYETLRADGLSDVDIMAFAGELLALVASDVRRGSGQS